MPTRKNLAPKAPSIPMIACVQFEVLWIFGPLLLLELLRMARQAMLKRTAVVAGATRS
jgi:hypothetical protein